MARSTLFKARLYGILDLGYCEPKNAESVCEKMIEGGVGVIQLRAKKASLDEIRDLGAKILPICRNGGVPFVINDFSEIATELKTDGVHVGQDDMAMDGVRAIVGDEMLVGRSSHSVEQAALAASDPRTDCIGFGPLFSTPTKPDYTPIGTKEIHAVHEAHPDLPIFCIGGIKRENVDQVLDAGAKRVVIVSGILQADDITAYVRDVCDRLEAVAL